MVLVGGPFVALLFAFWRSSIAEKQNQETERQSETARLDHMHRRFLQASDLLAHDKSHMRISGISAFGQLAMDAPSFTDQVFTVLICFIQDAEPEEISFEEVSWAEGRLILVATQIEGEGRSRSFDTIENVIRSARIRYKEQAPTIGNLATQSKYRRQSEKP